MQNGLDHGPLKRVFVLSAKSENSLTAYLSSFAEYLTTANKSSTFMEDLAFTLGQRRSHHSYRVAATADSLDELKTQLSTVRPRKIRDRAVSFVFTGQGAQSVFHLIKYTCNTLYG